MSAIKAFILDLKHDKLNRLKVFLSNSEDRIEEVEFNPYFYFIPDDPKVKKRLEAQEGVKSAEWVERSGQKALKVTVTEPGDVPHFREHLKQLGELREEDIPYHYRYLIDNDLYCMKYYDFEKKGKSLLKKEAKDETPELSMCSFDIEVYNKRGMPDPQKDEIIIIGMYDGKKAEVMTAADMSENKMLQEFSDKVTKKDYSVIVGYNSGGFDLPYMKKRATVLKEKMEIGRDGSEIQLRKGILPKADVFGRIHLDGYKGVEFLTGIGAMQLPKNDLESVYKELFGKEKIDIPGNDIYAYWDAGGKKRQELIEYNKEDSIAAYEIGEKILPLYLQLSKIVGMPIYEISSMATSQMIEWLLVREAFKRNEFVPKRPKENVVSARLTNPIKGAFVKLPESGLHEHLAVCDFRSLYPSLIISYNIDGSTLNCSCCKDAYESPQGHRFCRKKKGLMPAILEELIDERVKVKKEMKANKDKSLHFKQYALKILANSGYGYLGYSRARWYSREAAEAVTAFAREFIHDAISKAEKKGFKVLYADTDSLFLKLKSKNELKDVERFVEGINKELPEKMELELQGYYPRGIFVTKREGGAAKKRYALIREDGTIEIKGFEFVRRDWANIAKETQEKVIEAVLKEGKPEKAVKAVRSVIKDIQDKKVKIKDMVIYTQITRPLSSYTQQAPHVKAGRRLVEAGYRVPAGTVLEYVITKGSGSISDRAVPVQLIGKKEYDPEYYINNQVLPAVMKILHELGVKEEDLKNEGKQSGLAKWT